MSNAEPKSPLTIIAIFAGIIEASALASLPFLSDDSQNTYTWFLVGFPFFLTVLFFLTLNFNNKSLFSPPAAGYETPARPRAPSTVEASITSSLQKLQQTHTDSEFPSIAEAHATDLNSALKVAPGDEHSTVVITISGDRADQLTSYFAIHALSQDRPVCITWILYNLETDTQTTLVTQPIAK